MNHQNEAAESNAGLDDDHLPSVWLKRSAWLLFLLASLSLVAPNLMKLLHPAGGSAPMHDFAPPYSGARCLLANCDPYDLPQIERVFAAAGGLRSDVMNWANTPPVYPPSTLVELVPLSLLPYHAARSLWFVLSAAVFLGSFVALADFVRPRYRPGIFLMGVFILFSNSLRFAFVAGQTTILAVGLIVFALWLFSRNKGSLPGILLLGLSMGLKPQVAGIVFLYMLLRPALRGSALKAGAIAVAVLLTGSIWLTHSPASKNWRTNFSAQVQGTQQPGGVNDPSLQNLKSGDLTNLQTVFAVFDDKPVFYNSLAYALGFGLMIIWGAGVLRAGHSQERTFFALAAITCIALLPVYHRNYDDIMLIVSFPALLYLLANHLQLRWIALFATALILLPMRFPELLINLEKNARVDSAIPSAAVRALLFLRLQPLLLSVLAIIYLYTLFTAFRRSESSDRDLILQGGDL